MGLPVLPFLAGEANGEDVDVARRLRRGAEAGQRRRAAPHPRPSRSKSTS